MGEVVRAHDPRLGREVAIKVLPPAFADDAQRLARFEREARSLATLNHPSIVTIHELGEVDGRVFLVMELVPGVTLRRAIPPGGMPFDRVVALGVALADALAAAHDRGIVHRDLKPGNLMLSSDGRLKILDFGIARATGAGFADGSAAEPETITEALTEEGALIGSIPYLAPELIRGQAADARSDLFAAGVVLYESATGRHPFPGPTRAAQLAAILGDEALEASAVTPTVPARFDRVLQHSLEKDPQRRVQSARDLRYELEEFEGSGSPLGRGASAAVPIAPEPTRIALAVLPFENLSADPGTGYFAAGITEEITGALARIGRLRVIARAPAARPDGEGIRALGRELGVAFVLTGSVRWAGRQVRISAQLVDAAGGFHTWAKAFQGNLDDVFALQESTALAIARELDLELSSDQREAIARRYTDDVQAYDAFLRGRALMTHWDNPDRLAAAQRRLEEALAHDPEYAPALAALARAKTELYRNMEPIPAHLEQARELADRAVELAPDLAEAQLAVGRVRGNRYDYQGAAAAFRRAQELAPDDPVPWDELSWALGYQTPPDAAGAERAAREAVRLQPTMLGAHYHLGRALLIQGRLEEAEASFRHAQELDATFDAALLGLALVQLERRNLDAALDTIEGGRAGNVSPPRLVAKASIHAARDEIERAFEVLEQALELRYRDLAHLEANPHLAPLRRDPRWTSLIDRCSGE